MTVNVYIPTPYRRLTSGTTHVAVTLAEGAKLLDLVDTLDALHPGVKAEIWADEDFKNYVNVYVNGEEARAVAGKHTALANGDEVAFVPMLAGGSDSLVIERIHLNDMVAHAHAEYPNECCGLLSGSGLVVRRIHRMTNTEASPVLYVMDPREQIRVFDDIDQRSEDLVAIYHSHTHTEAYPSPTDVRLAYYPDSICLIVSLSDRAAPVARAFRIVDSVISEVPVEVR